MSNQEMSNFFNDDLDDFDKQMIKTCEKLYETELTSRNLSWQRFENNQEIDKNYSITFGTNEGIYFTVTGDTIKECFKKAIAKYDQDIADKNVPLDPMPKQSDTLTVFKGEQTDEANRPFMIYQKIKNKLAQDPENVAKKEAEFFLEYFKDHVNEADFELATAAQKIISK